MTFKPGQSGNPQGRERGRRDNRTIAREKQQTETSQEIGRTVTAHETLKAIYQNPKFPLWMRKDAARDAIRFETPALSLSNDPALGELIKPERRNEYDMSLLSDDQRAMLAILLSKVLGFDNKPTINAALPAPEPAPLRTERELLLAELAKHESAEEIARLRNEWPKE